jgi:hypothetical protein
MVFPDYDAFRVAVIQLIEGDEISGSTFSLNSLDLMIGLGESKVYAGDERVAGLRASTMVMPLSVAYDVSNGYVLPADLLELKELYFSGQPPLEIVPLDKLRALIASGAAYSQPRYAAQDGDTLVFWPTTTETVLGSYYARPEAIKTVDWADATTFARYPEVHIWAALAESAPFLGFDARMPMWETKFRQALVQANQAERMRVYGGSPLRVRAR